MTEIRNIAIIAHVDHGKTTLVDRILHQVNLFRENQEVQDLILDNNELERERGITILSKNVSVRYKDTKINIIDTPGHSDFGGEVERVLNMADGVLLIVDAFEGPMPQTRFVLQKAIDLGLKPIVVINKVDKPNCTPEIAQEKVFDLMFSLEATEDQLDFPTVFGSSKAGWMGPDWKEPTSDISYLLDEIIEHIPAARHKEGTLQMRITSLDYSSYTGRIAVGKVTRGQLVPGSQVSLVKRDGKVVKTVAKEIYLFEGLGKEKTKEPVPSGEICAVLGLEGFDIGDTIADGEEPEGLTPIKVDEPTMSMYFVANNSPFFGRDGKFVTSRQLRDRLYKETEKNLALRVEDTASADSFLVYGRGILHLSILVETMRREGFELQVGQPKVLTKEIDGKKHEPIEALTVHVPDVFSGKVIELVTQRKGDIANIEIKEDRAHLDFLIPARGLIGLRNQMLTATEGEAIMAHRFYGYEPWKGDLGVRRNGALISLETGTAIAYSIDKMQDRGKFFVEPGEDVYAGQVIGENTRQDDLTLNIVKTKKLTNMRAAGSDDKTAIAPAIKFSLEEAMEYIRNDEYIEITPKYMRLRKILLNEHDRKRQAKSVTQE
ncbi:translational GTPase TypA [Maribellus comscasis]|uniref:Large ribosomal subunit assembly factor BipA n=1 Tax=Maribellus comscasis TaxID=2681766 RepID=A0A6I6JJL0_9BACT|nr:translational GTPase TypA [Maribellus comscasis]QGY43055.1 translational GTPase TypA [Maribellus comscasis]